MKKILVIGSFLLLAMVSFASGPALKDCAAASATVSQTIDPVMPAHVPEAVVFYELPFAGTIPELGMPIEPAVLKGFVAGIWHPPVLSTQWLNSTKMILRSCPLDGNELNCRSDKLMIRIETNLPIFYPIAWYDIY